MKKTKPKESPKTKPIKKAIKKAPAKKKQVKKAKTKYNWALMKQEFMSSEHLEATVFLRLEYSLEREKSGQVQKSTKGWTEEKKAFVQEIYERTIDNIKDEQVKQNSETLDKLMAILNNRIEDEKENKRLSVKDLERLWGIFMTMNNKPTRYIKSDNSNVIIPVEELDEEEQESLRKKLKANGLI